MIDVISSAFRDAVSSSAQEAFREKLPKNLQKLFWKRALKVGRGLSGSEGGIPRSDAERVASQESQRAAAARFATAAVRGASPERSPYFLTESSEMASADL